MQHTTVPCAPPEVWGFCGNCQPWSQTFSCTPNLDFPCRNSSSPSCLLEQMVFSLVWWLCWCRFSSSYEDVMTVSSVSLSSLAARCVNWATNVVLSGWGRCWVRNCLDGPLYLDFAKWENSGSVLWSWRVVWPWEQRTAGEFGLCNTYTDFPSSAHCNNTTWTVRRLICAVTRLFWISALSAKCKGVDLWWLDKLCLMIWNTDC